MLDGKNWSPASDEEESTLALIDKDGSEECGKCFRGKKLNGPNDIWWFQEDEVFHRSTLALLIGGNRGKESESR